ncbi:MAG TPA: hypothetical protein VGR35_11085 [Tepidisphaeraceae bacterium]|nr:hypothetical protein [Tepidisphaeraceae bacterium]
MNVVETNSSFDGPRASTAQVLGLLVMMAFALSYLGAYAFTNALLDADILQQWAPGTDPRPRLLAMCFVSLLGLFGVLGFLFRILSSRQLRSIDALADETEEFRITDV